MEDPNRVEQIALDNREKSIEEIIKLMFDNHQIRVGEEWIRKTLLRFPQDG